MKKKASIQNTDRHAKVHGMYGSMHADLFEETGIAGLAGLRGMDLGFLKGFKNRRENIRPDGKSRGASAAAGAIAVERPVYVGGIGGIGSIGGFGKFGKNPGTGSVSVRAKAAASAGVLRKPAGRTRTRTRAKEQESLLRALGRSFSVRGFLLLMLAMLSISAALVLMLFNFKKSVIYGNTKYSQKQIESFITQGKLGENTFVMALKYHNRTVKGIPFVDRIDVDIINPSTVRVNITERPLDGCIVRGDDKIYFSRAGIIQTISGRTDENVTLVNGIELVNPETDAHIKAKNQSGMDNVLTLLNSMDRYDLKADSIDVDRLGSITVTFGDVRLSVGKTGYDMKMYKVHQIFPFFKGKSGCISMTGSDFRGDNIVLSPLQSKAEKLSRSEGGKKGDGGGKSGKSGKSGGSGDSGTAEGGKKTEDKNKDKKDRKEKDSEKEVLEKKASEKEVSEKAVSEKEKSVKESSEKETSEKERSIKDNPGTEKSEVEKQEQKAKAAVEKAEADAQKKAAGGEIEETARKPAEEQKAEEVSRKPEGKEETPDREKADVPAEEKEAAAPAEGTVGNPAGQSPEPDGEKPPEKPAEPVKENEEKLVDRAPAPATMEVDGQEALRASQKPMAPVAGMARE